MKKYFDKVTDRRGSGSLKWDFMENKLGLNSPDLLPMWVSDYDFKAPPAVLDALQTRIEHGVFGYAERDPDYYQAVINWYKDQYNIRLRKSWITTVHGVLPGLSIMIQMLTKVGDSVIMQTPGYGSFRKISALNERNILENPLREENGHYTMDLEHLESCFIAGAKMMILCNPHNPVGRAWSENEIISVAQLCHKYDVYLLSDEIWGDLMMPDHHYYSALSLPNELQQKLVVATAASKTFGLSSMRISNFMIANESLRGQFTQRLDAHGMDVYNSMAMCAATTAYQTSAEWLSELKSYLHSNIEYLNDFICRELPQLQFHPPQAGYLAWVDCRQLNVSDQQLESQLVSAGIVPSMGTAFGDVGKGFIRLNLGCPRETLIEACTRLKKALG
ncbi:MalY/PatB family protein [Psychromonas ossibalaenae]|uniref:MalY/PatB family protein n=1 Tax=Psychromonas ossibalaenae TaxID=444922 RepID=UPI00038129E5|nr:MalY/PatB family protein [Psychromonas ossibalaenae]